MSTGGVARYLLLAVVLVACSRTASTETSAPRPPPATAPAPSVATGSGRGSTITTGTSPAATVGAGPDLRLETVAAGFAQPVLVVDPPGDPRRFVVDQPGRVWVLEDADREVFLDVRDRVGFGGERGLLGLAFPPSFPADRRVFVEYTDRRGDTRIVAYDVTEDGARADPDSGRLVLRIRQPAANHNGGMLAFGPDGMLWIGTGDGGGANDRFGNGQDPTGLLGAMLRIDVGPEAPVPYGIPPGNPYAGGERGAAEVWAIGLRNPWRWSFDGGDLWIADVGQDEVEEIDLVRDAAETAGVNFGWPVWEGDRCVAGACTEAGFTMPVATYRHEAGCAVSGGAVYRGEGLPELRGAFFYGDFCSGRIWSVTPDGEVHEWTSRTGALPGLTAIAAAADGGIFLTTMDGRVLRLRRG